MFEFPRAHRLIRKQDFEFVFAKPYKISCQYVFALYRPNHQFHARLGIIIKKSIVRHAVDRNQLRRVIRESFRYNQGKLRGLDIIVMIQSTYFSVMRPMVKQNQINLVQEKKLLRDDINNLWPQFVIH